MGQTAQSYFEVNLNEKYGIAGEDFHGKLEIRINCDDFYARFVQIRLIGEELINDQLQHSIIQTDWTTVHVFQDRHLARGFYEYPVELTLPSALPSSIKSRKITGKAASYSCEIRYYVEVKINRENFIDTHLKEIHLPIIIFNPLPLIYANSQEQEFLPPQKFDVLKEDNASSTAATTDNLLGTLTMALYPVSNLLTRGQTVSLSYMIQNASSMSIESVSISLIETIHFTQQGNAFNASKSIYSVEIADQDLASINSESAPTASIEMEQLRPSISTTTRRITIKIPEKCNLTTEGNAIQLHHHLKLQVRLSGCSKVYENTVKVFVKSTEISQIPPSK